MRRYWILRVIAVAAMLAAAACGNTPPPKPPGPLQLRSQYENDRGASIGRDCGYSQRVPDSPGPSHKSIWLFCDTPVYAGARTAHGRPAWVLRKFIAGSTAAEVSYTAGHAPAGLAELPTPGTGGPAADASAASPQRFLPPPSGLVTLAGQPCVAANEGYAASWISGVARIPGSANLLVTYDNYCVIYGAKPGFIPEGFGVAQYNPSSNQLTGQTAVFAGTSFSGPSSAELLGSPVFRGGYLYLFGPACTFAALGGCGQGEIAVARVAANPLAWANPFAYRWWSRSLPAGGAWTPDVAAATSVIPRAKPVGVSAADFSAAGHGLVLVEQTDVAGRFTVYRSASPAGPWRPVLSARVPCAIGSGFANFCRAVNPHPELSTRGRLLLSYFDPSARPEGHVMIDGFPW